MFVDVARAEIQSNVCDITAKNHRAGFPEFEKNRWGPDFVRKSNALPPGFVRVRSTFESPKRWRQSRSGGGAILILPDGQK